MKIIFGGLIFAVFVIMILGFYTLMISPYIGMELLARGDPVSANGIVKIEDMLLERSDFQRFPEFFSQKAEAIWWQRQEKLYNIIRQKKLVRLEQEEIMSKIYVKDWFFVFIVILPLLQACATIKKDKIEVIDNKPRVSKVLKETSLSKFLKRKVAIARFSNETKYGQSILVDENKDIIGKQAMDILSAKLTATDKFILFERADIEKINKELKIGNLESLNIAADYLIVGSISEADYDLELNDKAISAAISKLVNNIVENLLDKPWRSYILSYENGNYLISGGKSQGIEKDDVFGVYKRGAKVKNSSRCKRIL